MASEVQVQFIFSTSNDKRRTSKFIKGHTCNIGHFKSLHLPIMLISGPFKMVSPNGTIWPISQQPNLYNRSSSDDASNAGNDSNDDNGNGVKNFRSDRIFCNVQWNSIFGEDGVIVWTTLFQSGRPVPATEESCPLVTLLYKVPDIMELKQECN